MTLIVSLQWEGKIILAADGMAYTHGSDNADIPYQAEKLHSVEGTNWILTFAGWGGAEIFQKTIATEVRNGNIPSFDPSLEVGGPHYLEALRSKATGAGKIPQTHVLLAGFDVRGKPLGLSSVLPDQGTCSLPEIAALGAQSSTANWLMNTLFSCCRSLQDVKNLAYFTISQIAKQELKVGDPSRYRISLCVLELDKDHQREHRKYSDLHVWFSDWEEGLRNSFMRVIRGETG